jgi:hypothetical protein
MLTKVCSYPASSCPPLGLIGHLFCVVVNFLFEWHLRWQSTRVKFRHWTTLEYIYHLRSFTMVSCMLLSHESQTMQTSRFSTARVPMNTCRMWYIERFGNVFWSCNFVICTVQYTHLCIRHRVQTRMLWSWSFFHPSI